MGVINDLTGGNLPGINISSFFSSNWFYVAIFVFFAVIVIITVAIIFFYMTYKKKVIIFENISGQGYVPVLKTRARIVKLGIGGEELLKTFAGAIYLTAYGKKMGKNTYWFAKGQDGYLYNIVLGDLDSKQAMLDIEPIDRDVRMFHVALDRLSHQTYGKQSFMEKYGVHMLLFVFLIVLLFGMWFIVGKIGEAVQPLAQSTELALKVQEANDKTIAKLDSLIRALGQIPENFEQGGSGLIPAT